MSTTEKRWKVFLCYARESQSLMDDFYDRFKNYNGRDMEILYDRNAESDNMHKVFHGFATQCDVAVLLVNARFVNPESYASLYEVPVLLERNKTGEVVVVGVRFSNVSDLEEWNAEGDVYFLSVTNNDLPYTRDKKRDDQAYLRKFAVYRQVDENDRDDFHDLLRQWIKKCLNNQPSNYHKTEPLPKAIRPQRITDEILERLTGFYYKIEKLLSMKNDYWRNNPFNPDETNRSLGSIYFARQSAKLGEIYKQLDAMSPKNGFFTDKLHQFMPSLEHSVIDCRLMIEMNDINKMPLFVSLRETERYIEKTKKNLLLASDLKAKEELKNINFPTLKHYVNQLISKMNDLTNDFDKLVNTPPG